MVPNGCETAAKLAASHAFAAVMTKSAHRVDLMFVLPSASLKLVHPGA